MLLLTATLATRAAQTPKHDGIKLEGFATLVTSDSITVYDKKNRIVEIHTDKDYTSLVGIAAPVTVWYTTVGGVNQLEDIVYPQRAAEIVPPDALRLNIKRLIILPRPNGVDDYQQLVDAISKYLADNAGWYVAPPDLAIEIASHTNGPTSSLDAVDTDSGKVDMQRYLAPQRELMTAITAQSHTDAVLEIDIVKVKAEVRSGYASWDDMKENVMSRTVRALTPLPGLGKGWVYAVSADMKLWDPNGKLLWRKRRGFAALGVQSGLSGKYRERPLKEVYANSSAMQNWMVDTLSQLAPPVHGTESP
jgi:hypothetical protein